MDMALDDIIKSNHRYSNRGPRGNRGSSRGNRGSSRGNRGGAFRRVRNNNTRNLPYRRNNNDRKEETHLDEDTIWEHDLFEEEEEEEEEEMIEEEEEEDIGFVKGIETGTKISVSNLEYTVSEENLKEVFERVGSVKKIVIRYDRSGRSEGNAEVTFMRRIDAQSAIKKYNGVEIDGKPVRLSLIGSNIAIGGKSRGNNRIRISDNGGYNTRIRNEDNGGYNTQRRRTGIVVQSSNRGNSDRRIRIGGNRGGGGGGRGRRRRYI